MNYRPDQLGECVVQELTDLPVIWKPLDSKGATEFDPHPFGEGYSLADWERDRVLGENAPAFRQFLIRNPRASFAEWHNWVRAGLSLRVQCTYAEYASCFREDDDPSVDAELTRDPVTGDVMEMKVRTPIKRFSQALNAVRLAGKAFAVAGPNKGNVIGRGFMATPGVLVDLLPGDVARARAPLDTHANAILTVGTGKTYATISLAITASSAGDADEVYEGGVGNVYVEQVNFGAKTLQLCGMAANQGIEIQWAGVVITGMNTGSLVDNFSLNHTANATAVYVAAGSILQRCVSFGSGAALNIGYGFATNSTGSLLNCVAHSNLSGIFMNSGASGQAWHCTCCNNAQYGFTGNGVGTCRAFACIAVGNGAEDYNTVNIPYVVQCASADLSVNPVNGSVNSFLPADFENFAGNDFRIRAAVAATTKARILGYPLSREDYLGNIRPRDGHFTAGAHEPAAGYIPAVGEARRGLVYGLDNELTGEGVTTHPDIRG